VASRDGPQQTTPHASCILGEPGLEDDMTDDRDPSMNQNRQGGIALGDEQHRATPDIARGGRAAEAVVSPTDTDPIGRVRFTQPVEGPVAPQMIDDAGEATPDSSFGDVAEVPAEASVWEAVASDGDVGRGDPVSDADIVDRARDADYAPPPLGKNDIDDGREGDGL
jgi:hypothetical protein